MVPEPTISDLLEIINKSFLKLETQINQRFHEINLRLERMEMEILTNRMQMGSLLQILAQKGVISHFEASKVAAISATNPVE